MQDKSTYSNSSDRSFSRANRLRGRSNFISVFRGRDTVRHKGRHLELLLAPSKSDSPTQIGIAISRKAGNAPARNRLKRILREYMRNNKPLWPHKAMAVIKIAAPVSDEGALLAELEDMLRQI